MLLLHYGIERWNLLQPPGFCQHTVHAGNIVRNTISNCLQPRVKSSTATCLFKPGHSFYESFHVETGSQLFLKVKAWMDITQHKKSVKSKCFFFLLFVQISGVLSLLVCPDLRGSFSSHLFKSQGFFSSHFSKFWGFFLFWFVQISGVLSLLVCANLRGSKSMPNGKFWKANLWYVHLASMKQLKQTLQVGSMKKQLVPFRDNLFLISEKKKRKYVLKIRTLLKVSHLIKL